MPFVGIKQFELIVLRGPVVERLLPIIDRLRPRESARASSPCGKMTKPDTPGATRHPRGVVPKIVLQIQPARKRDFDDVADGTALLFNKIRTNGRKRRYASMAGKSLARAINARVQRGVAKLTERGQAAFKNRSP